MGTGVIKLQHPDTSKLRFARDLRREMTHAETLFWSRVRRNQLGFKLRRQQIIEGFIADFFCEQAGLVIEIDGRIHAAKEQAVKDALRREVFEARGLAETRFTNEQVFTGIDTVVESLQRCIVKRIEMKKGNNCKAVIE